MDKDLKLIDLIDLEKLQQIQDSFSKLSGVAAYICDSEGNPVTTPSRETFFCHDLTKGTEEGCLRCRQCDKHGGELAVNAGKVSTYICHAGLVDCAAPIMVEGKLIGCLVGGQIRVGEMDEEKIRKTALEIGVDPEEYIKAAQDINPMAVEDLINAMDFIHDVTNVVSDIAYKEYQLEKAKVEIEQAAQLKSDFLANMSHEIRTPMNGVIGMAELALREELPEEARNYIAQIQSSGKMLLAIINDILDFSKIESGKLTIIQEEYELLEMVKEVVSVVQNRIGDKKLELLVDLDPEIPERLCGDSIRVKQILLNLANNAVKFTEKGKVAIKIYKESETASNIRLRFAIQDSGIGIKEEDIAKLFRSFQQVDSKRNRSVEGTGLGLAISKELVQLMNGKIEVESVYGKGSIFSFEIEQRKLATDDTARKTQIPAINVVYLLKNEYVKWQLQSDLDKLKVQHQAIFSIGDLATEDRNKTTYVFVDDEILDEQIESLCELYPEFRFVKISDFRKQHELKHKGYSVLKKPVLVHNLYELFTDRKRERTETATTENLSFVAPDARILLVDDNPVNLTVAEGLLKPMKMQVETAESGQKAINMLSEKSYDLIFMDHMMPDLDGVETTHIIRRFHTDYDKVPIIALTANAVEGSREMFLNEGMNDCVTKPIEMRELVSKLRKWLPKEKLQATDINILEQETAECPLPEIKGLDTKYSFELLRSEELFYATLKDFYRLIDKKAVAIKLAYDKRDWKTYTIEVHALKSASRQIGALALSQKAAILEEAGNEKNTTVIGNETGKLLAGYLAYKKILEPYCIEEEAAPTEAVDESEINKLLEQMLHALDNLDMDEMEEVVQKLAVFAFESERKQLLSKLRDAVEDCDVDAAAEIVKQMHK